MAFGDFFRPKYKHSNETTRLQAIDLLEDDATTIFKEMALNDASPKVRAKAIDKIRDPKELVFIGHRQDERGLKKMALQRAERLWISDIDNQQTTDAEALAKLSDLSDKQILGKLAAQAKKSSVRKNALARVEDPKMLGMVVRWAKKGESWRPALAKIGNQDVLGGIAIDDHRKEVAVAAVDKIEDCNILDSVVQSAKHKGAVSRAKKRLKALQETKRMARGTEISVEQMVHAERVQIVRELEAFSMGNEWNASLGVVETHVIRWEELALETKSDEALSKRFSKAETLYFKNRKRYVKIVPETQSLVEETTVDAPLIESKEDVQANLMPPTFDEVEANKTPSWLEEEVSPAHTDTSKEKSPAQSLEPLEQIVKDLKLLGDGKKLKGFERRLKKCKERKAKAQKPFAKEILAEYEESLQNAKIKLAELREADDWKRWANSTAMEQMVLKAKTLKENSDGVENLAKVLQDLQAEWKKIGPAPRAKSDECWQQFKQECDAVYDVVKAQRLKRNDEMEINLEQKMLICEEAETLSKHDVSDEVDRELKELQAKWKTVGPVPRRKSDQIWKRFKSACDSYFERRKPLLEAKQQEMSEALEEKENIVSEIEALVEDSNIDNETLLEKVKRLQRDFRDTGRVPAKHFKELSARLQVAGDKAFGREKELAEAKRTEEKELTKSLKKKIDDIRDAMWDESSASVGADVVSLHKELVAEKTVAKSTESLMKSFGSLLEDAVEQFSEQFADTHLDPDKACKQKEKLLSKLEELYLSAKGEQNDDGVSVAEKLKNAMANNSLGGVLGHKEQLVHGYKDFKNAWAKIGPTRLAERAELRTRNQDLSAKVESFLES